MRALVIGSGGREHALAWKLLQSPQVEHLWLAPGNGGTASLGERAANIAIAAEDTADLIAFARNQSIDLTVVGPEVPLAAGIVDRFAENGLPAFGPRQAAARIEASKAFAKSFMQRHGIPTGRYAAFTSFAPALAHLRAVAYPVVIKADGLAAGKGVLMPTTAAEAESALRTVLVERVFGEAGSNVVIEERLHGPEVSLLAFCDGETVVPMPPAQDHKRIFDGDQGPNTGGMGAFAPTPLAPPALVAEAMRTVLQPAVDGLRAEGSPFVGVLYAGLMLTEQGLRVLEFNCRFGDPETQAILLLLENDLAEILRACVAGKLAEMAVAWRAGAAATVALASGGYPGHYEKGKVITGLAAAQEMADVVVFHAGTAQREAQIVSSGGRVLNVSAVAANLPTALQRAYAAVERIHFDGMHYRRDIGLKHAP